jgi:hypothetical protein
MDPEIIGAIIGAVAIIVAALIGLIIQSNRKHAKTERQTEAVERLWHSLNAIDGFLRYELIKKIQERVVEPCEWTVLYDAFKVLREERLFLPPDIYTHVEALFDNLQRNINELLEMLREAVNMQGSGMPFDKRQFEDKVTSELDKIQKDYEKNLKNMRAHFDRLLK